MNTVKEWTKSRKEIFCKKYLHTLLFSFMIKVKLFSFQNTGIQIYTREIYFLFSVIKCD